MAEPTHRQPRPQRTGRSLRRLVEDASSRLGSRPEARWIVEHACLVHGFQGSPDLLCDQPAPLDLAMAVDSLVARRKSGEPLQYVLGRWPFRTLELVVDRRVLIPRPETEQVVEVALGELSGVAAECTGPMVAVDLGTGSGAIALALALEGGDRLSSLSTGPLTVWGSDRSSDALDVAETNLAMLRAAHPAAADRVRLVAGSWFGALPDVLMGSVDLLVSNPPYVSPAEFLDLDPTVREWEPRGVLVPGGGGGGGQDGAPAGSGDGTTLGEQDGMDGMADIETIIEGAPRWLADGGVLVLELAPHQADAAAAMARHAGLVDVRVEPDLAGRLRALVARREQ